MAPTQTTLYTVSLDWAAGTYLRQAEPVAVEGLVHVWCVSALVQEQLALIHLCRTAE